jgi:hypothetical protein
MWGINIEDFFFLFFFFFRSYVHIMFGSFLPPTPYLPPSPTLRIFNEKKIILTFKFSCFLDGGMAQAVCTCLASMKFWVQILVLPKMTVFLVLRGTTYTSLNAYNTLSSVWSMFNKGFHWPFHCLIYHRIFRNLL